MRFLKLYVMTALLCYAIFFWGGGWVIFDFEQHLYLAVALWALVIAVIAFTFELQGEKVKELEKRIKALEEKNDAEKP